MDKLIENSRDRVLSFEKELSQSIERASRIEAEVRSLGNLRRGFLTSLTSAGRDHEVVAERIAISRAETSAVALDVILCEYSLKETHGNQELQLIELSTRPLASKETYEQRSRIIAEAHAENQETTCQQLVSLISTSLSAKSRLRSLFSAASCFEADVERSNEDAIAQAEQHIQEFNAGLKAYLTDSELVRRKVTSDYLVLRHNSRVAERVLSERRQAAIIAREELQSNLDELLKDASRRRAEVEDALRAEQSRLLQEARENLMRKESEVDNLAADVRARSKTVKQDRRSIRASIREFEHMYRRLERRRAREVRQVGGELKRFREMIAEVELSLAIR
jgi:hypothetical protein